MPIGIFYGTNFGVGKSMYQSVIAVMLGNVAGGAGLNGIVIWFIYGQGSIPAETAKMDGESTQGVLPS